MSLSSSRGWALGVGGAAALTEVGFRSFRKRLFCLLIGQEQACFRFTWLVVRSVVCHHAKIALYTRKRLLTASK